MTERRRGTRLTAVVLLGQLGALLAWLWPIGLGGKMPVGGDVTQFSIGLMAFLRRSLRSGHWPLWNDLWGYGFPGVGESQMGVYYPPHWVLFGGLPLEWAYTASLVLHAVWGSLGTFWASRRFGVSPLGAGLAGLAWSTSGFFLIHLPHQWAFSTGSWMPWAWGLAWATLHGDAPRRGALGLALVLALQLLPGHFQLAFCTQVLVGVLLVEQGLERLRTGAPDWSRLGAAALALGGAFPLAAMQLWPTWRLARLAAPLRDYEYLSGFAATPLHLITFVAPGLFEVSPLWRPIVWDPFHTSPEEYLGYVGIVPLFLAVGALRLGRRAPEVRALATLGLVALVLAFGPYVPGFRAWCQLPGFSFFRAPARWMIGVSLALAMLAGLGFDRLPDWRNVGRSLRRFAIGSVLATALVVLLVEGLFLGDGRAGASPFGSLYDRALGGLPWGEPGVAAGILRAGRQPNLDARVFEALARQGVDLREVTRPVFVEQRFAIYRQELAGPLAALAALAALSALAGRPRWLAAGLLILTLIDLGSQTRHRRVDFEPIAPLTDRSAVLARLARLERGSRTLDTVRNLPIAAGVNPVSAYRTLDLPALDVLTLLAGQLPRRPEDAASIDRALVLTGVSHRVYEPAEVVQLERARAAGGSGVEGEVVADPVLAGWRFGAGWVAQQSDPRAVRFLIRPVESGGAMAWRVPLTPSRRAAILGTWSGEPARVFEALAGARPLSPRREDPEHLRFSIEVERPELVVISQLADPQWRAFWSGPGGDRPAAIGRAFGKPGQGAWQVVETPGPGTWELKLTYPGEDVGQGLIASGVAFAVWAAAWVWERRASREAERKARST